jgi:hypothetical protein
MTGKKLTSNFSDGVDFSKQRKNSVLIGGSKEEQIKRYHQMVSGVTNGTSTQINGTASTSSTRTTTGPITNHSTSASKAKPRRNTVMAVNGQLPNTNGL